MFKRALVICDTSKSASRVKDAIHKVDEVKIVDAIGVKEAGNYDEDDYDAIIVAPRVSAHIDNLRHLFPNKPMQIIPFGDYFENDGKVIISLINKMILTAKEEAISDELDDDELDENFEPEDELEDFEDEEQQKAEV